nr:hypothetical protein [Caldibacillus debilis]
MAMFRMVYHSIRSFSAVFQIIKKPKKAIRLKKGPPNKYSPHFAFILEKPWGAGVRNETPPKYIQCLFSRIFTFPWAFAMKKGPKARKWKRIPDDTPKIVCPNSCQKIEISKPRNKIHRSKTVGADEGNMFEMSKEMKKIIRSKRPGLSMIFRI